MIIGDDPPITNLLYVYESFCKIRLQFTHFLRLRATPTVCVATVVRLVVLCFVFVFLSLVSFIFTVGCFEWFIFPRTHLTV